MKRRVLKFGGSLLRQPGWRDRLLHWVAGERDPTVIVPGGGVFADTVRQMQGPLGFDDLAAHEMAILAMAQTACVLRSACPSLPLAPTPDAIESAWLGHRVVVWQPTVMPDTPASWAITSDSLAAWLAARLQASELLLLKSCPLPPTDRSQGVGPEALATWDAWAQAGTVDPCFPTWARAAGADIRLLSLSDLGRPAS